MEGLIKVRHWKREHIITLTRDNYREYFPLLVANSNFPIETYLNTVLKTTEELYKNGMLTKKATILTQLLSNVRYLYSHPSHTLKLKAIFPEPYSIYIAKAVCFAYLLDNFFNKDFVMDVLFVYPYSFAYYNKLTFEKHNDTYIAYINGGLIEGKNTLLTFIIKGEITNDSKRKN